MGTILGGPTIHSESRDATIPPLRRPPPPLTRLSLRRPSPPLTRLRRKRRQRGVGPPVTAGVAFAWDLMRISSIPLPGQRAPGSFHEGLCPVISQWTTTCLLILNPTSRHERRKGRVLDQLDAAMQEWKPRGAKLMLVPRVKVFTKKLLSQMETAPSGNSLSSGVLEQV